jgi:DNA repair protein RadC
MLVATARDAESLLAPMFDGAEEEKLGLLHLDADGRTIAVEEQPSGEMPLRAIIRSALDRDAAGLVIAHNHPSGDPTPSPEDIETTRDLAMIAARLGIRLHDHLIFAGGECASFRALGLL